MISLHYDEAQRLCRRWEEFVRSHVVIRGPLPTRVWFAPDDVHRVVCHIELGIRERDTDTDSHLRVTYPLHGEPNMRQLRVVIQGALLHELDENLYFDGKRIFDPHNLK